MRGTTGPGSARDALDRRYEALVFDWDGTAVPDRRADAGSLRAAIEELCELGMHLAIVSGTDLDTVDRQLGARPSGPGSLLLALDRGSTFATVGPSGPRVVHRRSATPAEDRALDVAAAVAARAFAARGLTTGLVVARTNRRKIDLVPGPRWHDPPKAAIAALLDAVTERLRGVGIVDLAEAVRIARSAARDAGLPDACVTTDAKHVEIGLTGKDDAARWVLEHLAAREGIGAGLVLIAGDEFGALGGAPGSDARMLVPDAARATAVSVGVEPGGLPPHVLPLGGGPATFGALLADQVVRRRRGEVPHFDPDPAWTLRFDEVDHERAPVVEALLTVADGRVGSRGPSLAHAAVRPLVLVAGCYDDDDHAETALAAAPVWHGAPRPAPSARGLRQVLDLRTAAVHEADAHGPRRAVRFASLADPGVVVLRADCPAGTAAGASPLVAPGPRTTVVAGASDGHAWMVVPTPTGGVTAAATQRVHPGETGMETLDRFGAYTHGAPPRPDAAVARVRTLAEAGFEALVNDHRRAWATRWHGAHLDVTGDPGLARDARFALAHVLASVDDTDAAAVGARGLTGPAYRGHVFWDADVFVLPVLAATNPPAARAMLEYRVRRLPAARRAAQAQGRAGARFPWESAESGTDVTPDHAHDRAGRTIPIRTGAHEAHVVGCVAWAAAHYLDWTGDESFAAGPGTELLVETARYWASCARTDAAGRAHLYGVIGPDEYHEPVDDNAFTNVLARWNLRRAAAMATERVPAAERDRWRRIADALVDGLDPATGRYEQFAGFFDLEPLVIADLAPRRPIAADLWLGYRRVREAQVVKQADVLMLHHLLPAEVAPGSLAPNLAYYEPRTAHGSSLSPGIHAALLARAGRTTEARRWLGLTARIDLDVITRTTAGGVHLATMATVWHALAFGALGVRPHPDRLELDPRVPPEWGVLEVRLHHRGTGLTIRASADHLTVTADGAATIAVGTHRHHCRDRRPLAMRHSGSAAGTWRPATPAGPAAPAGVAP